MNLYHSNNIAKTFKEELNSNTSITTSINNIHLILIAYAKNIEDYIKILDDSETEVKENLTRAKDYLNKLAFPIPNPNEPPVCVSAEFTSKMNEILVDKHDCFKVDNPAYQNHPKVKGYLRNIALVIRKFLEKVFNLANIDNNLFKPEPKAMMISLQQDIGFALRKYDALSRPTETAPAAAAPTPAPTPR